MMSSLASTSKSLFALDSKSEASSIEERSRATAVALNAEIRPAKDHMMNEVPMLHKLALNKVKGLSREELASCNDLVLALPERIKSIPDGTTSIVKQLEAGQLQHLELDRQVPLIDEMDTQVGNLTSNCLPIRSEHQTMLVEVS
ncbi:hypothetical protein ACSBR2_020640 [Camellia fascicularis]